MRVLNEIAMKADVDHMFDATMSHQNKSIRDWFKGSWLKQLTKTDWFVKTFLHKMSAQDGGGMFHGLSDTATKALLIRVRGRKVEIKEFTTYDVKDAKAGTLFWYAPTTHSLLHFNHLDEIIHVRDYFKALLEENPNTDLRRINAVDAVRATTTWHSNAERRRLEAERLAEVQRQLELDRMTAEERKRAEAEATKSIREWRTLSEGRDWTPVCKLHADGSDFVMIRLISAKALVVESSNMAHCTYTYKDDIYDGKTVVLSVRPLGMQHHSMVTVELHTDPLHVIQIQPYHNGWVHESTPTIPGAKVSPAMKSAIQHACLDTANTDRFRPIMRPGTGEFHVNK